INQGRFIANTFGDGLDVRNFSSVNLNGGTLQVNHNSDTGTTKSYTNLFNVTAASTIAFFNSTTTAESLLLSGTTALDLGADLTVQNISTNTTLSNLINFSRNITGAGDIIVDGYNTITSSTTSFGLGRVALGGNNSGWSGDLVVREGAAEVYGDTAVGAFNAGTGDIILGETSNTAGAAFMLSASTPTSGGKTLANDIVVRAGDISGVGFRTLRGNSDHSYNINGTITLEGDLNVHNGLFFNDKNMTLNGVISGVGDLIVTKNTGAGFTRLTGNNSLWSGDLMISQGALNLFGTANTTGTGDIVIGATGDATAASLTFSHTGSLTYTNDIIVSTGGTRTIQGNSGLAINVTFSGGITLNGDLTVDHSWSSSDRRFNLNGPISGGGGLKVTRSNGSTETTLRMAGTKAYLGNTTVAATASLALASDCVLTSSNVEVQATGRIGGPGTIGANLTLADTANFFFYAVGVTPGSYVPMTVNGTVTLGNNFSVANIVGGSRGEAVAWDSTADGTYTLIGTTLSSVSNIQNFGSAAYATIPVSATSTIPRYAYFQGSTGLQIVVSSTPPAAANPFTTWSGGAAFDVDSNNDGVDNGLAWFFGAADKDANATGLAPKTSQAAGALVMEFDCLNATDRGLTSFTVQYSSDLGLLDPWAETSVPGVVGTFTAGVVDFEVTDPGAVGGLLKVVATIPAGEAAAGRLFSRVTGQQ
ncbi:hypothetical protein HQ447_07715, partial [bacterium]|nr:hypothetical protein [bacterium]